MTTHDDSAKRAAVRLYVERVRSTAPVARSWMRLQRQATKPPRLASGRVLTSAVAGAIVAGLLLGGSSLFGTEPRDATDLSTSRTDQGPEENRPVPAKPMATLALSGAPVHLPVGRAHLSETIDITAEAQAAATAAVIDGHPRVELEVGQIRVDSNEHDDGRKLRVWAGPYEFVDIGTVFEVSRDANTVSLFVRDGVVQVLRDAGPLANVAAGETWRGTLHDERTSVDPPSTTRHAQEQHAPVVEGQSPSIAEDCRKLVASGKQRVALSCYEDLARGSGLLAQTALYELANLRRDGGDPSGALATLRSYGVRFPNGALTTEVELSMIELLAKLNQHGEALERSAALLARQPNLERSSDLRVLRGNLYREAMGDLRRAAIEYDLAQSGRGRAAVEALFLAATCAEALGDRESAARLYTRYLSHGDRATHAADARNRLLAISSLKE